MWCLSSEWENGVFVLLQPFFWVDLASNIGNGIRFRNAKIERAASTSVCRSGAVLVFYHPLNGIIYAREKKCLAAIINSAILFGTNTLL